MSTELQSNQNGGEAVREATSVVLDGEKSSGKKGEKFEKGGGKDLSNGPMRNRGCTDLLCLIFFCVGCVAFLGLLITGFILGDHRKLYHGKDVNGDYCGLSDSVKSFPRALYTINPESVSQSVDIPEDPSDWYAWAGLASNFGDSFHVVCTNLDPCPTDESVLALYSDENTRYHTVGVVPLAALPTSICPYEARLCLPVTADHTALLDYYCVPSLVDPATTATKAAESVWSYVPPSWTYALADVETTWPLIPLMAFIALIIGIVYLLLVQVFAAFCAWIMVGVFLLSFAVGGLGLFLFAIFNEDTITKEAYLASYWGGIGIWCVGAVALLLVLCLIPTIVEGAAIMQSAAMFVTATPTIYIVPAVFFCLEMALILLFTFGALFIVTMDQFTAGELIGFFLVTFFLYLWIEAWLSGMCQVVMAGAVGWWYFTPVNADGEKNVSCAVMKSTSTAFSYHTGSVAFGAFILAVIRLIKWVLKYLQAQAKAQAQNPQNACKSCLPFGLGAVCGVLNCANGCVVWVIWAVTYLVECFERCIEYINNQAYIQVAIVGRNFCKSAWEAFSLITRNPGRFSVAHCMGRMIVLLGVLVAAGVCGVGGYFLTIAIYGDKITSAIIPTIIYVVVAIAVTVVILSVLTVSIDTILHCFLADKEMSGEPDFAPAPLREFMHRDNDDDDGNSDRRCCSCC